MTKHLTEAQRLAVEQGEGPILILAGAGSGKTRTLTHRIASLIEKQMVKPSRIMAVTFTRKAADEMAVRLSNLLFEPAQAFEIHLGTFHALSAFLLRESARTNATIELLPETGQIELIKGILQAHDLSGPEWQPREILRKISLAKGRLLMPEDMVSGNDAHLATIYQRYQQSLGENHLLDFDDLINVLIRLWEQDEKVLNRHQDLCRAILVDEFQDVNQAQYRWLKLLAAPHRNLCVVGDTDQSIYAFRGSHTRIFQQFQEDFPEARTMKLEQNFRSSQCILEAAGSVITHNANPLSCKLWSESHRGPLLRLGRLADEDQEARFVVGEIERLLGGSSHYQIYRGGNVDTPEEVQYSFADFAILYRTHAQSRPLADALSRAGMPYQLLGERPPFATQAADALLSYLRFAVNTESVEDLRVVFNLPPRGLGERAQEWLSTEIDRGLDPWEILQLASRNFDLPVRYQAAVDRLRRIVLLLQKLISTLSLQEVIERAWQETGLRQHFQSCDAAGESLRWLLLLASPYGNKSASESLSVFLDDLLQWRTGDFFDPRADAVTLMTLHAAKGLEFPVVFICGLDQNLVPLALHGAGKQDLEEERRLFYVGMTRARQLLVLTTAGRRFLFGKSHTFQPSAFLREIPAHCLEEVSLPRAHKKKPPKEKQLSLF